jgi:hypothetical protein
MDIPSPCAIRAPHVSHISVFNNQLIVTGKFTTGLNSNNSTVAVNNIAIFDFISQNWTAGVLCVYFFVCLDV